jgi:hypothetical protein
MIMRATSMKRSRQAQYDRLTALPRWVRISGKMSGAALIASGAERAMEVAD